MLERHLACLTSDLQLAVLLVSTRHFRKRFLSRISHIAVLELNRPDIVYNIVGAMNAYKIRWAPETGRGGLQSSTACRQWAPQTEVPSGLLAMFTAYSMSSPVLTTHSLLILASLQHLLCQGPDQRPWAVQQRVS